MIQRVVSSSVLPPVPVNTKTYETQQQEQVDYEQFNNIIN